MDVSLTACIFLWVVFWPGYHGRMMNLNQTRVGHNRHRQEGRHRGTSSHTFTYSRDPVPARPGPPGNCIAGFCDDPEVSHESNLIKYLLWQYKRSGKLARPVRDSTKSVNVEFGMTLVQILDFDETKQLIISNVWKSFQWVDENLRWNPDDYGGLLDLRLPPSEIWTPDIVLYNNADDQYDREVHHELIAVLFNGTVKWIPSAIYKSSCEVDMTNFPFDQQTCLFKFGSWTYDGNKVNLNFMANSSAIDMQEYVLSSEWNIVKSLGRRNVRKYTCCGDDPYPELIYYVSIKRRTAFYIVVLILPCILLSCLTLVMFWFPPQRPDRTGLGMSLFSSFFVLLLILVQSSPPTSHSISLLGVYYCINMILIALSTLLSAIVINMFKHKHHRVVVPKWMLKFRRKNWGTFLMRMQGHIIPGKRRFPSSLDPMTKPGRNDGFFQLDEQGRTVVEWRMLATAMDRFFFSLYLLGIFLSMVVLFPSADKPWENQKWDAGNFKLV